MGVIAALAIAAGTALVASLVIKDNAEQERRRNTPFTFPLCMSEEDFRTTAIQIGKKIKRVEISTSGPVIHGVVTTQSGLNTWKFTVDFNDYGSLTGKYWLNSENSDSSIPQTVANRMVEAIRAR